MKIELRDLITIVAVLVSAVSVLIVSRNARRATVVQSQNTDLTRIRDLRSEVRETKTELDQCKAQVTELSRQLAEASEAAMVAYRERAEMLRFAQMPGVTMEDWRRRFERPPAINE